VLAASWESSEPSVATSILVGNTLMGRNLLVLGDSLVTTYCHPAYMSVYGGNYQPEYVEAFLKNFALTAF
jgi:hypothetical protein